MDVKRKMVTESEATVRGAGASLWMEMCDILIYGYLPPTKALGQSCAFGFSYTLLCISSMDTGFIYQVQLNVNKHLSTVNNCS